MCGSRIRETASSASPTPLNQSVCWPSIRIRSGPSGAADASRGSNSDLSIPFGTNQQRASGLSVGHQVLEPARHHQEVDGRAQRKRRAEPLEGLLRAVEALLGALHEHDPSPRIELQQSGQRLPPGRDGHVVRFARRVLAERATTSTSNPACSRSRAACPRAIATPPDGRNSGSTRQTRTQRSLGHAARWLRCGPHGPAEPLDASGRVGSRASPDGDRGRRAGTRRRGVDALPAGRDDVAARLRGGNRADRRSAGARPRWRQ